MMKKSKKYTVGHRNVRRLRESITSLAMALKSVNAEAERMQNEIEKVIETEEDCDGND